MNSSSYRFTLDLHSTQSQVSLPVTLGDTARVFYISLADGGLPYIIADGCLAKITIKRPTSTPEQPSFLEAFCAIEGNTTIKYDFEQNKNTAAVEGIHDCSIDLYDAEGKNIGSPRFTMIVSDRVRNSDDITLSDDDVAAVDAMLVAEAARQSAENGRVSAESARVSAESTRTTAEEARNTAESERKTSEDGRVTAEARRVIDAETRRAALDLAIARASEFDEKKLNKIDLVKCPNGDPDNPSSTYEVGSYVAIYSEYYGADGKWRERLLRANNAAYPNLTDSGVEKFKDNLLTARIPMTDSVGRLSVASPQKGANGETYYYNPDASAATNNTQNMAIPLWYGDERYVRANTYSNDKKATDKKITELEEAVANAGGDSSAKLYRHDITLDATGDFSDYCFNIRLTIYNSNSESYSAKKEIDWDNWEEISGIPLEKFSFLPVDTEINAGGAFLTIEEEYDDNWNWIGDVSKSYIVVGLQFYSNNPYGGDFSLVYEGDARDWSSCYSTEFYISDVESITDVVTEVK